MRHSMNERLELTWIPKANRAWQEPRLRIDLAENPRLEDSARRSHDVILDACAEPRCGCLTIRFQFPAETADGSAPVSRQARQFWFDLNANSIVRTPELEKDAVSLRLAEVVRAQLTDAERQRLREWYLAAKLEIIQTTPVSEIDITDLPDAEGGKMIGFVDVFPCGLALNFTLDNEAWAVDEQYCVQPRCTCSETVLSFLKLRDAAGQTSTTIRKPPSLRYNYRTQAVELLNPGPAGSPSPEVLLAAVRHQEANFHAQLELRHLIMQSLYLRSYFEQTKSRLPVSEAGSMRLLQKVGRNDPCPCGSGRKYKFCCLNKSGNR